MTDDVIEFPGSRTPEKEYLLTKRAALIVCMTSDVKEAKRAADVREEMVRVILAYRSGELAGPTPLLDGILKDFR